MDMHSIRMHQYPFRSLMIRYTALILLLKAGQIQIVLYSQS